MDTQNDSTGKKLPARCPACQCELKVKRLFCDGCDTEIEGIFALPQLARLPTTDQQFIVQFVKASGSLKEMARLLGLSYPTVRNQLNDIIERVRLTEGSDLPDGRHSDEGERC